MEKWQIDHINTNLVELIRNTSCNVQLIARLQSVGIISQIEAEDLENLQLTPSQKSKRLYDTLKTRKGAFQTLISTLIEVKQTGAAHILQNHTSKLPSYGLISIDQNVLLGTGRSGTTVYKGTFDGRDVAVKVINTLSVKSQEVIQEIELLKKLDKHENIVRYYLAESQNNLILVALELCKISLEDEVCRKSVNLDAKTILRKCTNGLAHLHALKVVHRDIKPANILLTDTGQVKISDFGVSKQLMDGATSALASRVVGTFDWMAPEIANFTIHGTARGPPAKTTYKSDIFSMGCVFFFVLTNGSHPYGDQWDRQYHIRHGRPTLLTPEKVGEQWYSLISKMVNYLPNKRPSTEDILKSDCFLPSESEKLDLNSKDDKQKLVRESESTSRMDEPDVESLPKKKTQPAHTKYHPKTITQPKVIKTQGQNVTNHATFSEHDLATVTPNVEICHQTKSPRPAKNKNQRTVKKAENVQSSNDATSFFSPSNNSTPASNTIQSPPVLTEGQPEQSVSVGDENENRAHAFFGGKLFDLISCDCKPQELAELKVCWQSILGHKTVCSLYKFTKENKPAFHLVMKNLLSKSLCTAIHSGNMHTMKMLINNQSPLLELGIDRFKQLPLFVSIQAKQIQVFEFLVSKSANIFALDENGENILHKAARTKDWQVVHGVLEVIGTCSQQEPFENSSCSKQKSKHANQNGPTTLAELFSWKNKLGYTPLHHVCEHLDLPAETLDLFLACGRPNLTPKSVDINAVNEYKNTPLMRALMYGRSFEFVSMLARRGANLNCRNMDGENVAHVCAKESRFGELKYFVGLGVPFNEEDVLGNTVLQRCFCAKKKVSLKIVTYVISVGADLAHKNKNGETAYDMALKKNYDQEYLKLLTFENN